jgi:hypothetical protein
VEHMDYKSLWDMDDPDSEGYQEAHGSTSAQEDIVLYSTDDEGGGPSAREESRLFDLIGKIDLKILQGGCVYIQVNGLAYKVLYGVYWRSIHSGVKYWGFRCEQIERGMWSAEETATSLVDIPICYTTDGWKVEEQSLKFLLYRDMPLFENSLLFPAQ